MTLNLDSVDTVLSTARSVRRKLDFEKPIPRDVLLECIDLAAQAPTGLGGESWRFMIVTDTQPKARLAQLYGSVIEELAADRGIELKPTQRALVARLHEMPALIFVCSTQPKPGDAVAEQVAYYGSILPAAWSLMLGLRSRGIGTTWTTLLSARQQEVAAILGIPNHVVQTVMMPAAYTKGAKLKRADRLAASELTYWNEWQSSD